MKTSIRNLRKLIREAVKQVLKESKCPHCGDPEAYEGLFSVECPNGNCQAYSEKQAFATGRLGSSDNDKLSVAQDYFEQLADRINNRIQQDDIKSFAGGGRLHMGFEVQRDEDEDGNECIIFVDGDEANGIFKCCDGKVIYDLFAARQMKFEKFKELTKNVETPDEIYDVKDQFTI